jgi:endonuclease/exonuclease/phosphatase family metal-dependent hydrolase
LEKIRIFTYNILDGGVGRESLIFNLIEQLEFDILLIQEATNRIFIENLANKLDVNFFVAEGNGKRKLAILSKHPILTSHSFHSFPIKHTLLEACVSLKQEQQFYIFGVHLAAYPHIIFEIWRLCEILSILGRIKSLRLNQFVIGGDFNSIAPGDSISIAGLPKWIKVLIWSQGGFIPRIVITIMRRFGLVDCFRKINFSQSGFTLPASRPNARLDYFFVSPNLQDKIMRCEVVSNIQIASKVSDHLPLLLEIDI